MKLIFRRFLLSAVSSLSPSFPAIGYFGNDLYSCGVSLVRACARQCNMPSMLSELGLGFSVLLCVFFFFTPLVFLKVISLSLSSPCFASSNPRAFKTACALFITQQNTVWDAAFFSIWYLHCAPQLFKRLKQDAARQWAPFTDSINYASKKTSLGISLAVRAERRLNSKQCGSP